MKSTKHMRKDNLRRAYPYLIKSLNTCRFQLRNYIFLAFRSKKLHISDKKVSIIIPTLSKDEQSDHLVKLKRLLSAYLPQQSHKNYEAIVFCDGKNDMVENMVMSLKDTRIRLYFTENTLGKWGHPQTRLGVEIATGDF
ncbi:MAG: glycosyltransferase family A protein, partial [Candidatus Omnitrophica bacterium]|nr:glycosyltransferase family A protein [Candidatus Omnitrophota bacterium]